ncbi:MAG: hypothetical protein JXR63_04080 [Spirochaetales bacterium]|nr:hypothetical protein [Spirochaetales bacterium]
MQNIEGIEVKERISEYDDTDLCYQIEKNLFKSPLYLVNQRFSDMNYLAVNYRSSQAVAVILRYGDGSVEEILLPESSGYVDGIIYFNQERLVEGIEFASDQRTLLDVSRLRAGEELLLYAKDSYIVRHFLDEYRYEMVNGKLRANFGNFLFGSGLSIENTFLNLDEDSTDRVKISVSSGSLDKKYSFKSREGLIDFSLYLPPVNSGLSRSISYDFVAGVDILKVSFRALADSEIPTVDFCQLLDFPYDKSNPLFNLYRWDINTAFLVFDFIDYKVQARFLKRLAFFVEKPGYRGTLPENSAIERLHGWNAHDYRAYDLAAFFTKAKKEKFELNPEEYELLDILLENKILVAKRDEYKPLSGGFISISRQSSQWLRKIFLDHEGYHALFFDDPELREFCESTWDDIVADERKEIWKSFFDFKQYDYNKNKYLLVNEFFAYSLQSSAREFESYVKLNMLRGIVRKYPDEEARYIEIISDNLNGFVSDAKLLEEFVEKRYNLIGGNLRYLD